MQPHIVAHLFSAVNKQLSRRENEPNWPDLTEWKVALYTWALSWKAPSSLIFLVWFFLFPVTLYSLKLSLRSGNTLTELQSGSQAKGQNLLSKSAQTLNLPTIFMWALKQNQTLSSCFQDLPLYAGCSVKHTTWTEHFVWTSVQQRQDTPLNAWVWALLHENVNILTPYCKDNLVGSHSLVMNRYAWLPL